MDQEYVLTEITDEETNKSLVTLINQDEKRVNENEKFYSYKVDGQTHYIPASQVTTAGPNLDSYMKKSDLYKDNFEFDKVTLSFDKNGRISKIVIPEISQKTIFDVNTTRVHDDEGFDAALRDYTMSKDEYNKAVADLNAQTEKLQQEDKILEMRLDQIDTEQQELQTELEAVKKVLDENIENTFKTFA